MDNEKDFFEKRLGELEKPEDLKEFVKEARGFDYEDLAVLAEKKIASLSKEGESVTETPLTQVEHIEELGGSKSLLDERTKKVDQQIIEVQEKAVSDISEITKEQSVEPKDKKEDITSEGQIKVDLLIQKQQAFEITSKEEIEKIKKNHKQSLESIDSKIQGANDKYKQSIDSIDLKITGANYKYQKACESLDSKINGANEKFKKSCDALDLKIKVVREKQGGEKYQKEREINEFTNEKQSAKYQKEREINEFTNEKQSKLNRYQENIKQAEVKAYNTLEKIRAKIAQAKIDANPKTLENVGQLEAIVRKKISSLIENTKSEEDKDVYQEFVSKINNLKNLIKKNKLKFEKETAYPSTIENMTKYSSLWKEIPKNSFSFSSNEFKELLKNINNPKKVDKFYGYLSGVEKLTPIQTKEIFKTFGFGDNKQLRDIYEDYNKNHKSRFGFQVKQGKKHDFTMNSNSEGVALRVYNYGDKRDEAYFFLDQKFIKELFENSKV